MGDMVDIGDMKTILGVFPFRKYLGNNINQLPDNPLDISWQFGIRHQFIIKLLN
jgi:hypothetical protein